jgi:hypothetical protein
MSNLSFPSYIDSEGKPPGWRHWWDIAGTPNSSTSPLTDDHGEEWEVYDGHEEEVEAVVDDGHEEEEEEEEDEEARWTRLEAEERQRRRER